MTMPRSTTHDFSSACVLLLLDVDGYSGLISLMFLGIRRSTTGGILSSYNRGKVMFKSCVYTNCECHHIKHIPAKVSGYTGWSYFQKDVHISQL
ncbi:hypothetical protein KQX54_005847 [Cotesia glomerata]|uniref:Uncharacterized protein n=1 Tax=Cotesia glomerata TaxID=32391 RepID=A0AAV7HVL6_COTGL|nr:hypothetical protein KQX54_005847 [Cotesia glomerata]